MQNFIFLGGVLLLFNVPHKILQKETLKVKREFPFKIFCQGSTVSVTFPNHCDKLCNYVRGTGEAGGLSWSTVSEVPPAMALAGWGPGTVTQGPRSLLWSLSHVSQPWMQESQMEL